MTIHDNTPIHILSKSCWCAYMYISLINEYRIPFICSILDTSVCLLERVVKVSSGHVRHCGDFFQVLGNFIEAFKRHMHSMILVLTSVQKETCCGSTGQAKLHPYCSASAS